MLRIDVRTSLVGGLGLLALEGCGNVCGDDGFVWQQAGNPACQAASVTDGDSDATTDSATDSTDSAPTTTMDPPTTTMGMGEMWCKDADGDGFGDPTMCQSDMFPGSVPNADDCADDNADAFPGSAEKESMTACMEDADGDGFGDSDPPEGVEPGTDCADDNANAYPGAAEAESMTACMEDADEDGWGDDMPPEGVDPGTDCNDDNSTIFPGAAKDLPPDQCTQDSDGDGHGDNMPDDPDVPPGDDCADDDVNTFPGAAPNDSAEACMTDADGDDWGDDMPSVPEALPGTDCADDNPNAFPGAAENESEAACMEDEDGDGWGDDMPPEGVTPGTDCDDTDAATGPGVAENEVDPNVCQTDADGDGWADPDPDDDGAVPGTDCDDNDANTFPGAAPNDDPTACMTDADGDDWGDMMPEPGVTPGTDCTDRDPDVHENCARCNPNEVKCVDKDLHTCNDQGTAEDVVVCENGCDDDGLKCWDPLSVEAGMSICVDPNMPAPLNAIAMGGDGMYTYSWDPPETLDDATIANPVAMPLGPTTYTIDVSDGEGNTASDSVTVYLKNQTLQLDPDICETYDFPGAGEEADPATNWQWNQNTQTLCQTVNGKSAALFCGWDLDNATITGEFQVTDDTNDDDWIGFMWGIQDTDHYYLFSWKRVGQNFANCGGQLPAGMQVKVIDVLDPNADPQTCADRLQPADTVNSKLLVPVADFTTMGWTEATVYTFELTHKASGEMTIIVRLKANNNVVAMKTFMDTTYANGKFGMYTKSQVNACFSSFVASCVP
ncbi:hypothetical protein [Nannocystis sp. SCPEA4]|uniref:hypothetical protein n=1 Tax=Nannocystis sp. SCPEA4 TaxID=2996787 RepID=UPI00226ED4D5|nr:hypothetical protein [Nannocystis sp. SCPEA4]MCY1055008.1 hypothetical protein [Nannocystis sp. SCPEA4]